MNQNEKGELRTPLKNQINSLADDTSINVLPSDLLLNANDLMNKFDNEPPSVRICEFPPICTGEVSYIFGTTGAGKSIFTMQLAIEHCNKIDGNVCYIDAENKSHQLRKRYPKGTNFPKNLLLMDMKKFLLETDGELTKELVQAMIKQYNIEWLIIDNLGFVASDAVQDAKISIKLAKDLFAIVTENQTAITIIAHSLKRDNNRPLDVRDLEGSSKLSNYADCMLAVGVNESDTHYTRLLKARETYDRNELRTFEILEQPYCKTNVIDICSIEDLFESKGRKPSIDYSSIASEIFSKSPSYSFTELVKKLEFDYCLNEPNAKKYVSTMLSKNIIIKDTNKYHLNIIINNSNESEIF